MPTYTLRCTCDTDVDIVSKWSDVASRIEKQECASCGKVGEMVKVITSAPAYGGEKEMRPNSDFRDVMKGIKKASGRDSTIRDY